MIVLPKNLNATKINLSGTGIREIPPEVFLYKNLRKLFLRNNKIVRIPKEINQLKLLTVLDISNNDITSLQAKIFDLKKLEVLILNCNKIKNIPSQIKNLKRLRILGLANNKFISLNEHLNFLTELKELNLSGNAFVKFPLEILNLKNLEKLWMYNFDFGIPDLRILEKELPNLKRIYCQPSIAKLESKKITNIISPIATRSGETEKNYIKKEMTKKIFISYSHQDKEYLDRVKTHLKVLKAFGESDFEIWDDKKIKAGDYWQDEIKKALNESTAAILLISTDYLASDFIQKEELQPLLTKAKGKGTLILSLIVKPCMFEKIKSLSVFQAINDPKTQILSELSYSEKEHILISLTNEVERHIQS